MVLKGRDFVFLRVGKRKELLPIAIGSDSIFGVCVVGQGREFEGN